MSQLYKNLAAGPVPPTVPTQFTTDDGSIAIPSANNLNVLSTAVTENNLNGIQTRAVAPNSDNLFIELTNRATGAVSTNDATPTNAIVFPLAASPTVYVFSGLITAFDTTDIAGAGYFFTAAARTTGAAAILISAPKFDTIFEEAGISPADIDITVSGNNFNVVVIGIAAKAIDWLVQFTYSQVI